MARSQLTMRQADRWGAFRQSAYAQGATLSPTASVRAARICARLAPSKLPTAPVTAAQTPVARGIAGAESGRLMPVAIELQKLASRLSSVPLAMLVADFRQLIQTDLALSAGRTRNNSEHRQLAAQVGALTAILRRQAAGLGLPQCAPG